jgi:hypothetical protein
MTPKLDAPAKIKITNPDLSALVGIGSNSGGVESA